MRTTVLGAGFIGTHYIRHALAAGDELCVLSRQPCPAEFAGKLRWMQEDFADGAKLAEAVRGAARVFHFISSTVPGDVIDESRELSQNVFQTLQLLKLCLAQQVERVIFTSSSSVYGLQSHLPIPESAPTDPISSHGIHKLTIEKYLYLYQQHYGLEHKILRISNPYGPGQSLEGRQGAIAIAIGKILRGEPMLLRDEGRAIRDFVYIGDVIQALHEAARTQSPASIFNIGSGEGHALRDVMALLERVSGKPLTYDYAQHRPGDIPQSVLDITRARAHLGYAPSVPLEAGLSTTLQFYGLRHCAA